jgi:flagellar biosynthesis protein FlhG
MQILPVASGKGGVGKSLLAANLAIVLAQSGRRVVLADADLGGSNLHLILGQTGLTRGIGNFLNNSDVKFEDILIETEWENLRFVPGDAEIPGTANLKSSQKKKLIRRLLSVDADYLIMDLGAGTNFNTVDFFLTSGKGIIITAPTPTANLNAYLFLKNVIFRLMDTTFKKGTEAKNYIDSLLKTGTTFQQIYVPKLIRAVSERDPKSFGEFKERAAHFQPRLVLNMIEDPKDAGKAKKLRRSCKEYLDIDMEHLGIIYRDELQDIALKSKLPIVIYKPDSVLSQAIYRLADKLLQDEGEWTGPMDFEAIEDSYQEADMEAEIDFETKMRYMEDLLHSGTLTEGDLVETIKTQQYEINQLRKENNFLKKKVVKAMEAGFSG